MSTSATPALNLSTDVDEVIDQMAKIAENCADTAHAIELIASEFVKLSKAIIKENNQVNN